MTSGSVSNRSTRFGIRKPTSRSDSPPKVIPAPQGPYYCSVGAGKAVGREIVEEHLELCLEAGLNVEGINAEVMMGQWEFQIFAKGAAEAGDQIWVARYLLERVAEKFGLKINWHCKPVQGDWNGSGMHANFSNTLLRTCGSKEVFEAVCQAFEPRIKHHIDVYGADNHQRLTGLHETQSIDKFSYGVSDRGASIRIPVVHRRARLERLPGRSSPGFQRRPLHGRQRDHHHGQDRQDSSDGLSHCLIGESQSPAARLRCRAFRCASNRWDDLYWSHEQRTDDHSFGDRS